MMLPIPRRRRKRSRSERKARDVVEHIAGICAGICCGTSLVVKPMRPDLHADMTVSAVLHGKVMLRGFGSSSDGPNGPFVNMSICAGIIQGFTCAKAALHK